jgi:hypothetical protein
VIAPPPTLFPAPPADWPDTDARRGWLRPAGGRWRVVCTGTVDECWSHLLALAEPGDKAVLPPGRHPTDRRTR